MIAFPPGAKVWLAGGATDMRKGMNGLALLVQQGLARSACRERSASAVGAAAADEGALARRGRHVALREAARPWSVHLANAGGRGGGGLGGAARLPAEGIDWRNPRHTGGRRCRVIWSARVPIYSTLAGRGKLGHEPRAGRIEAPHPPRQPDRTETAGSEQPRRRAGRRYSRERQAMIAALRLEIEAAARPLRDAVRAQGAAARPAGAAARGAQASDRTISPPGARGAVAATPARSVGAPVRKPLPAHLPRERLWSSRRRTRAACGLRAGS